MAMSALSDLSSALIELGLLAIIRKSCQYNYWHDLRIIARRPRSVKEEDRSLNGDIAIIRLPLVRRESFNSQLVVVIGDPDFVI